MDERRDLKKEWSITDVSKGARTTEENISVAARPKSRKKFNVLYAPLFPNIPLANVVTDNLHLFLCVSDVLINNLVDKLLRQDTIEKAKWFTAFESSKHKFIYSFQTFAASVGIPSFNFYVGKTSKQLKW